MLLVGAGERGDIDLPETELLQRTLDPGGGGCTVH